ncbi:MAG: hypothetical protein ACM3ZE_18265, partial [Myxococcales bacterium]
WERRVMHNSYVRLSHWCETQTRRFAFERRLLLQALGPNVARPRGVGDCVDTSPNERKGLHVVRGLRLYLALLVAVALLPLVTPKLHYAVANTAPFPGWPVLEPGSAPPELPLTETELGFARNFPGKIGKFGDSHRSYVVRWVTTPTRRLHPAEDCYRASGFTVHHESRCPAEMSEAAGCFTAVRNGATLLVQERIIDSQGKTFSDVSAWYWAAMRGVTAGPWWSVTKVTPR